MDVTKDRGKYVGGSDIPAIMGLSPYKTRRQLLEEKAGIRTSGFGGNKFTNYGNLAENAIREYAGIIYGMQFVPEKVEHDYIRCHLDGYDNECGTVLEVKTTGKLPKSVEECKQYLVQILYYMVNIGANDGVIAVYERPEDFENVQEEVEQINPEKVAFFDIYLPDYAELVSEIMEELRKFWNELEEIKSKKDELVAIPANCIEAIESIEQYERQLEEAKTIEKKLKAEKKALHDAMEKAGVTQWVLPGGTKITRVEAVPAIVEEVSILDIERLKVEKPDVFAEYSEIQKKEKKGRAGYVRITH